MVKRIAILLVASTTILIAGTDGNGPRTPLADAGRGAGPLQARPSRAGDALGGLQMQRPYRRGKIPVVLIHGLVLGPSSWSSMIAGLEADRRLSDGYQFWTFAYETSGPILYSAAMLRQDLARARRTFDPDGTDRAFDEMVLIGHSMGGLLARLMAQRSGSAVWDAISDHPFEWLAGPPMARQLLREMAFFERQRAVRRLIFIATPHVGSRLGAWVPGEIATSLLHEPEPWCRAYAALTAANPPDFFVPWFRARCPGGIQDLAWGHPVLAALSRLGIDPAVKVHSIIAQLVPGPGTTDTDGLVSYRSAHLEGAVSERIVPGGHLCQDHPQVIAEVRRILREHLVETGGADREGSLPGARSPSPVVRKGVEHG
jgi:pimeloyl-ACP methyl ester carboxylesterase